MASADGVLSYQGLIREVRRLCSRRMSGCIFITTSENHAVRFELHDGTITAVSFRQQLGLDAIPAIKRITGGQLRYSEDRLPHPPQNGLPATPELLAMLNGSPAEPDDEPPVASAPVRESLARSRPIIESELAEFLGPMAQVVCGDHIALATGMNELIESLAKELADAGKAARFKERVRARLAADG